MHSDFTFASLAFQLKNALDDGYRIIKCSDYVELNKHGNLPDKFIVLRIDIDVSVKKAVRLAKIFSGLSIKGSFFLRLHANEYNPFSFENYRIVKTLISEGHEIGYHSEVIDQAAIWKEDPIVCLKRDLLLMENVFNIKVRGVASHGGMTGLNNLDFWKSHKPKDFDLDYEAYDREDSFGLFYKSLYISDSEWTKWKCYLNGEHQVGDRRSLIEHLKSSPPAIYLLIHPETYFDDHFYE